MPQYPAPIKAELASARKRFVTFQQNIVIIYFQRRLAYFLPVIFRSIRIIVFFSVTINIYILYIILLVCLYRVFLVSYVRYAYR